MVMEGSPTVIEPTTSADSPLPKIANLSPHTSSSSDSSRPNSEASSRTSPSVSPSPIPKSLPALDSDECIELPALPSTPSSPRTTSASQPQRLNGPPRSIPPALDTSTRTNHEASWLSRLGYLIPTGQWLTNTLSALSLGLTLVGMIVFGRLTIWQAWNDAKTTCVNILSSNKEPGPNCQELVSQNTVDVILPPWKHWKRSWNATIKAGLGPKLYNLTLQTALPIVGNGDDAANSSFFNFSSVAVMLASTAILGSLTLIVFRRYWKTEDVFTSPVRSDWQFTRHHQEGPETVTGEGYRMIRRNPENGHPLGQLREHIRKSQPNAVENPTGEPISQSQNTSEKTLIGPWENARWGKSKVSLTNDTSDERHENLIELETEGPNKTFFDPETGEFIHLTPWKSTGDEEVHGLRPDGKGSIKRAFAMMTLGATGWAGGKSIDDQLAEELQANSKGVEKEPDEPRAGDCITGDMINKAPSGKPTTG